MRPLCSSDRRRVSLVCRTQTEVWCTKPNRRRGLSPAVSVKNPISPAAFGLRWNSYFHHDLWVAPKKSSIFCTHLRPKVARPKNLQFLCRVGWEHPRRKWRRRPPLYPRLQDLAHVDRTNLPNQQYHSYHSYQFLESLNKKLPISTMNHVYIKDGLYINSVISQS